MAGVHRVFFFLVALIWMYAESNIILRAVAINVFFNCRCLTVLSGNIWAYTKVSRLSCGKRLIGKVLYVVNASYSPGVVFRRFKLVSVLICI